jgi:hypothetical protein
MQKKSYRLFLCELDKNFFQVAILMGAFNVFGVVHQ